MTTRRSPDVDAGYLYSIVYRRHGWTNPQYRYYQDRHRVVAFVERLTATNDEWRDLEPVVLLRINRTRAARRIRGGRRCVKPPHTSPPGVDFR